MRLFFIEKYYKEWFLNYVGQFCNISQITYTYSSTYAIELFSLQMLQMGTMEMSY